MFQRFFGHQQIILVLLWRMAIMYFLFQVTRIGFFVANADTFPEVDFSTLLSFMAAGLIFDTTALMYTNILFIVSQIIPLKIKYRAGYQQAIAILF